MHEVDAPDLQIEYTSAWVDAVTADRWLDVLLAEIPWRQEHIRIFGREVATPRLTAWHGDPGCEYTYSGLTLRPQAWTPVLGEVCDRVSTACGTRFNGVLLNRYRDGRDSMGWHADDEPELGPAPVIASVTLGCTRTFQLKHRTRRDVSRVDLDLEHGSLLVMRPPTQAHWLHGVPKRRGSSAQGERVNLTFRRIERTENPRTPKRPTG